MRYILLITSLLVIGFSALVSIPDSPFLIGGYTQAEISDMYPTSLTPAGFAFSIWSIIYLSWIIVGCVIAGWPATSLTKKWFPKLATSLNLTKTSKETIISFSSAIALTALWLIPWGRNMIGASLMIMIMLLITLKYAYRVSRSEAPIVRWSIELTLGWIHIATVANVTIWLVSLGYTGGLHPEYWAIGVIGLAWLLTLYYQIRYRAYIISLVFLWAVIGIWYGQPESLLHPFLAFYHLSIVGVMVYTKWFSLEK